ELALARGRERHQRKEEIKRRIVERELRRAAARSRS
ncbi:MAG: SsrA-binding protein, partial [Acidobacteria bacterium]